MGIAVLLTPKMTQQVEATTPPPTPQFPSSTPTHTLTGASEDDLYWGGEIERWGRGAGCEV